jgi:hypothetical protein
MFSNLPPEIDQAIETLWAYADDACASSLTKKECDDEGYDCHGEYAHFLTFVISRGE